jgi:Rrf2 family protein
VGEEARVTRQEHRLGEVPGGAIRQEGKPVRLSFAAYYALKALVHLAARSAAGALVPSQIIAERRGNPARFLLKVLSRLAAAQILLSVKGPHGGFRLARPAGDISILEVVEAVDGPIRGEAPLNPGDPDTRLRRRVDQACGEVAEALRAGLAGVTVSDLAAAGRRKGE